MQGFAARLWHSPTFTTWGSIGVRLMSVLLVLPLVLVRFEPAEVAVWQLFATLFTLMLLLDFGLSPTFSRLLAYARGGATLAQMADMRGLPAGAAVADAGTAANIFGSLRWLFPRLALIALLLFGIVGTISLQRPIAMTANPAVAWLAWALVLPTSAIGLWGCVFTATLQGMNQIAILRRWEIAASLGQVATCLAVLAGGGGLLALVAAYQCWTVIGALLGRVLLKRLHPELFAIKPALNVDVMRIMWPATWRSGIGILMGQGVIQASGVAYGQMGSPSEVAAYLLALRVMTVVSQFAQAPFYSKLPRLAEMQARGERAGQMQLAQHGMRLAHWINVAGVLAVAVVAQPMLSLIGSKTPFVAADVWALMALACFAERFGAMHLQLFSLTNNIKWHIASGVTGILMIVIATAAYPYVSVYAFPLAMLLAYACFYSAYSAWHSQAAFGFPLFSFETVTSIPPALLLLGVLVLLHRFPVF